MGKIKLTYENILEMLKGLEPGNNEIGNTIVAMPEEEYFDKHKNDNETFCYSYSGYVEYDYNSNYGWQDCIEPADAVDSIEEIADTIISQGEECDPELGLLIICKGKTVCRYRPSEVEYVPIEE